MLIQNKEFPSQTFNYVYKLGHGITINLHLPNKNPKKILLRKE